MMPLKPNNWPEVREWRKSERRRLLALRAGMGREARSAAAASILPLVHEAIRGHGAKAVGLHTAVRATKLGAFDFIAVFRMNGN